MTDANDQESQPGSAIDGLNRLGESGLLRLIQSVTATLEEALARQRALESADTPTHNGGPNPESRPGPESHTNATET